ncbi:hypothetical protein Phum_PHUM577370 [Pediculus humanus corporis]|uniref:Uncharacterized protein n=1 Tax=Pediculus humanus subsp. corporis TaxID=121224 RepID=E0W1H9_PEDHC|nr:uncharacterized protein Phum_PHUM577370 [Pediculus humanus corporis]EEB19485.1 hypothetical protein Phum_PHUM577370 [Pediculus humanus corporis]
MSDESREELKQLLQKQQLELESLQARHLEEISMFKRKISQRSDIYPIITTTGTEPSNPPTHTRSSSAPQTIQQVYYTPVLYQDLSPVHVGTACSGSNLEDYLVYTTAPQSPTYGSTTSKFDEMEREDDNFEKDNNLEGSNSNSNNHNQDRNNSISSVGNEEYCQPVEIQQRFVTNFPSFRRLSSTSDGLLQITPAEPRQIATSSTGFYFPQNFTPIIQSGLRFVGGSLGKNVSTQKNSTDDITTTTTTTTTGDS